MLNQKISAGLSVDGIFGPKTMASVKNYQAANGLAVDGIVGPITWGRLTSRVGMPTPPPADPSQTLVIDGTSNNSSSSDIRTIAFVLNHPIAAGRIGEVVKGKTNISTNSQRFASNGLGLSENDFGEGSQVNAFRHVLWQATITQNFSFEIASEIGYAHEENPNAILGIKDFDNVRFTNLNLADEAIDLLNNIIGREIGLNVNNSNMRDIAFATLNYYHTNGLWIAVQQANGYYSIKQEILSDNQYRNASQQLIKLDSNGFAPQHSW